LSAEGVSLVEAIERPPGSTWVDPAGRRLTAAGLARVRRLRAALRTIRAQSFLPLPELVAAAERTLGLDIEVLAQPGSDARDARRHLDEFAEVAAGFSEGSQEPTLGAFLAWLEAAAEHERGLDRVEGETDPFAVQVLTVHAAKGLEWDVVAVVGLADGSFPAYDGPVTGAPASSAWLTALTALPYPLRGDAEDLPHLDVDGPPDHAAMAQEWGDFRRRAGEHLLAEERRLAYVAVTRARHHLVLAGSWWKEQVQLPRPPSRFLAELRRREVLTDVVGRAEWDAPADAQNPLDQQRAGGTWPPPATAGTEEVVHRGARAVRTALASRSSTARERRLPDGLSARAEQWVRDVELLLAERAAEASPAQDVVLPAHLSASSVVRLVADPAAFALERRRPVPEEPAAAARRGTRFHAWVERHFGAATLLDVEDFAAADDERVEPDPGLEELQAAFLASPWAARTPLAVEVSLETPVGGAMIRCRVDAVFATPDGVQIVDWKTGPPPRPGADADARQVQLALYRLAWSRLHDMPLSSVSAAFYHVAQDVVVPAEPLGEDEIVAALTERLASTRGAPGVTGAPVPVPP
jgi:DNA helicase-2/ATP-dependent DNA helicase PcrA